MRNRAIIAAAALLSATMPAGESIEHPPEPRNPVPFPKQGKRSNLPRLKGDAAHSDSLTRMLRKAKR